MEKMRSNKRYLVLERGKHFTLTAFAKYLNNKYGTKSSGTLYSAVDVQKYVVRGHLPEYLGGNEVSEFQDKSMGIKLIYIENKTKKACV